MKTMLRVFFLLLLCLPNLLRAQCPVVNLGADTLVCVGMAVTLDAGNPGATFLWSDGTTTQQLETFFEGEYSVEVTANGCTTRDTIYVAHGPVIQADFTYVQSGSCSPFITTFSQFSQACSASIIEWSWNFGDGSTSTLRDPSHTYALPGDYIVSLTVESDKGAIYTAQQTVTISGQLSPVVNLGSDRNLCFGNEIILAAGNAGATYNWSTGETSQAITVVDGGQYHVTVSKNGCTSFDTVTVTSVPMLWSDFNFQKLTSCLPVKYKFTDNSSACESSITDWFWEFGDGTTSTAQHPEHEFTSQAQFNVKLTVTDNNGNSIRRSKRITVTPSTLSVNLGSDTTICFGNSVELDAGNTGATFNWSTGASTQKISVQDDGDYIITVMSSGCVAKDTIRVNTSASVANRWSYNTNGGCLPIDVSFTDSSVAFCNQNIQTWQWDFGDGTVSHSRHPVHTYYTADSFVVRLTVTTTSGATSTSTKKIGITNSIHTVDIPSELKVCSGTVVTIDAGVDNAHYTWGPSAGIADVKAKIASISATGNRWYYVDVAKCSAVVRDSVYVIADSTTKPGIRQDGNFLMSTTAYFYEWFKDGKKINGATQKNLRIDEQGYYQVKAISNGGCERLSDAKFFMPYSGKEKDEVIRIKCTPNPGYGKLNVLLSELPEKPAKLTVFDRYGRVMFSSAITGNVTPVNLMRCAKGLYYVEVKINNKRNVMPVVVQ